MTWIKIIPPEEADPHLSSCYAELYALFPSEYRQEVDAVRRPDGTADSISAVHSLIPDAMRHAMSTLGVLLDKELPLTRRQHEMIATLVSSLNQCFY